MKIHMCTIKTIKNHVSGQMFTIKTIKNQVSGQIYPINMKQFFKRKPILPLLKLESLKIDECFEEQV